MKRAKTSGSLLELPLTVPQAQARRARAHLEVARHLYITRLGKARACLTRMHNDPAWKAAWDLPRSHTQQRAAAFSCLRSRYGCSEYAMLVYARGTRCTWIAEHIDSTMAQTLATRAYAAVNRLTRGEARHVRFKSKGRGIDSVEGRRNDTGMRFVLQKPKQGNAGYLLWGQDHLAAIIDWGDRVIKHGLDHPIKYVRLARRKALSPQAKGAASTGHRYYAQLLLEDALYQKKKHRPGSDTIGLDTGPSSLAIFPREGKPQLLTEGEELRPDACKQRRLQRKMDRQRRTNNPENHDEQGRIKKQGGKRLQWKTSRRSLKRRSRSQRYAESSDIPSSNH